MAKNKLIGIEEVLCDGDKYIFKSDFSFLASVHQTVEDPMVIYTAFCEGHSDPNHIRGVMCAGLLTKNGDEVTDVESEIEDLITRNGLQECWMLCRHLLTYGMVGDVKKQELRRLKPNKLTQLITEPFQLENSKNRLLLWAYHLLISGISVCISFSLFVLLLT